MRKSLYPFLTAMLVFCSGVAPTPSEVRSIAVSFDCAGCDASYAIALFPTGTFAFSRASREEFVRGRDDYVRFTQALTRTSFFDRVREQKWVTLSSGSGEGSMVITAYACSTPTCVYGSGTLYRVAFEPALAPDLAAYVQSVYALAEPAVIEQENTLRRRLLDVGALRAVTVTEFRFLGCRNLRATFDRPDRVTGSYDRNSGQAASFTAIFPFERLTSLLARSHPEFFARLYGQSTPLELKLEFAYNRFNYGVWAPSAAWASPSLVSFMGALNEDLRVALGAQCG